MNGKHNIGKRVSSFELYDELGPITGIALLLDNENELIAGDDSGYMLEVSCPFGTQAIANNLLASFRGKTYQGFRAENAVLDPTAELGDDLLVNGVQSVLAHRTVTFGPGHMSEIEAPGESTMEHEFQWKSPEQKEYDRKLATTRSLIEKTAEQIRLSVEGVENEISYIQLGLDNITSRVQDAEGNIATLELTANSLRSEINGKIDGDYAQTLIDQTLEGIELSVSSSKGSTTFKIKADGATLSSKTLDLTVDAVNITGKLTASQIDAEDLEVDAANVTGTLSARSLALDGALELTEDGEVYGYMGVNEVKGGPVMSDSTGNIGVIVTNNAAKISYKEDKMIWVANGGCYSSYTMQVYSDKRLKNSINYDLSKAEALFPLLKPCSFIMNSDKDGKTNWGFISNEVIESATSVGLDAEKLALIGKSGEMHTLAYGQITALNTHMIQKLMARMDALEGKNNEV